MIPSFDELEYKYKADGVMLSAFQELMYQRFHTLQRQTVASWDIYYAQETDENSFQRFRMDREKPELTKKVKTNTGNNWVRVESDLPLDPKRISETAVRFHVGLDGYKENFRIFKACDIFVGYDLNYVYYVVFDSNMTETGRFIEVEVNKERVLELELGAKGSSMAELRKGEALLEKLGITAQNRLKKSLFEIYRKVS